MSKFKLVKLGDKSEEKVKMEADLQVFATTQLIENEIEATELPDLLLNAYIQSFSDYALLIKKRYGQDAVNTLIEDHMRKIRGFIRHVSDTCR